ncbi:ParB/RepB/Spo0J family partition protein [Caldinitratiruptor microaerophilus]|uniref:Chromosome partitioning protein ParB n=1 Tax=Caldinitratiruptor microaerophilus TaxID=671077 RepID=A0AA35GB07_9FIRM|nr:ParB/RepB/Spo0J family partition protein [Caldinitratiruptor microaerophilus]BDG61864.1 chromosome partitioning protein ParB [Caldinitratiruptor microaerophilus]
MSRRGLGRGLGALIPEIGPVDREQVQELPLDRIRPNPRQPRKAFAPEALEELAASIREHGVVQPVLVRPVDGGYELVAGERRWRAARAAGLERIPAVVREITPAKAMEIALIENLQREDLNPLEEAEAYRVLLEEHGLSHEELARRLGKSRPQISNTLRLLQLPQPVQALVASGVLSMGHAKVLLGVEDPQRQAELATRATRDGLSVRALEQEIERLRERPARGRGGRPRREGGGRRDPEIVALEARLRERFGTPVRIHPGQPRGRIEIHYFGNEDLTRLVDALLGAPETGGAPGPGTSRDPFPV